MFNVYKNQQSQQTGSRNLTGPKTLPTIWYTYMMLVTKYQISAINSYWEKCDEKFLGQTDRGKTVYPPPPSGSGGIKMKASHLLPNIWVDDAYSIWIIYRIKHFHCFIRSIKPAIANNPQLHPNVTRYPLHTSISVIFQPI
jgi:hypothetical protein